MNFSRHNDFRVEVVGYVSCSCSRSYPSSCFCPAQLLISVHVVYFEPHNDIHCRETLTMQTVHYVIQLVGSRYESVIVEKNLTLAKQHSTRYASMYVLYSTLHKKGNVNR